MDITPEQFERLVKDNGECLHGINELKTQNQLILRFLNGDPGEDVITGIRPRLRRVEETLQPFTSDFVKEIREALQERSNLKQQLRGAKWLLGVLGATNVLTLGAIVRIIVTGGP